MINQKELRELLEQVASGQKKPEEAILHLKEEPYKDMGFAKVDMHRGIRQGVSEVIYGEGKTKEQILKIVCAMRQHKEKTILITRLSAEAAQYLEENLNQISESALTKNNEAQKFVKIKYEELSRTAVVGEFPSKDGHGTIVVATGGTSDIPVAEEAALTAEAFGNEVVRLYDVGVAGLHRLMDHMEEIMSATVIIAIAGMEGALASVIGGMADCPVIAVPTSVGYGANFGGLSALLSMLNSCASGVSVVNIDNGFGAGYQASMINHLKMK